jgi:hypothetical protein
VGANERLYDQISETHSRLLVVAQQSSDINPSQEKERGAERGSSSKKKKKRGGVRDLFVCVVSSLKSGRGDRSWREDSSRKGAHGVVKNYKI